VSNLTHHPAFSFIAILGFAEIIRRQLMAGSHPAELEPGRE